MPAHIKGCIIAYHITTTYSNMASISISSTLPNPPYHATLVLALCYEQPPRRGSCALLAAPTRECVVTNGYLMLVATISRPDAGGSKYSEN